MRTTLNIADGLIEELMALTESTSKTQVIEMALLEYIRKLKRENIKRSFGRFQLDIDVENLRNLELHE